MGSCNNLTNPTYADPVAYDLKKNNLTGIATWCGLTNPPTVGSYTADSNAVRVVLEIQKKLAFSGLFMNAAPTIRGISTATIVPSGDYCVISLENQAVTGIDATGSTDVDLGCGMITNSTSMSAAVATGSSDVGASPVAAVGGIPASTHWHTGTVLQPFTLAQADPFAGVTAPPATDFPSGACPSVTVNPNTSASLTAGCYSSLNLKGNVTLGSGTYIIDGGSFSTGAQANVSCSGCTIVLTNRSSSATATIGGVDMNGGADVDMTAPSSGTYKGILIYQDRRATADNSQKVNGNSSSSLQGRSISLART
ncbi:hypothetical protein H9L15_11670 [Sphingomonas daechungensis]|uniref:Uncharacterized protein n=1 Tax=Sphingomonas daechungensis TaxID=1176646 RepID=A0ABX6T201_9SPHN|nr:hypothetical protein [Sphingomonas daechungensis]QNP42758.1 hypothetical protein H9L15_11670 [Sphingomonas daechungensis]